MATSSPLAPPQVASQSASTSAASNPNNLSPFPPASTFSILPDIYALISRLSILQTAANENPISSSPPSLDLKDLPSHVYSIKQKLARARAAVAALPDVDRSVAVQEAEIGELEGKITALKKRINELAAIAKAGRGQEDHDKGESDDVPMQGVAD